MLDKADERDVNLMPNNLELGVITEDGIRLEFESFFANLQIQKYGAPLETRTSETLFWRSKNLERRPI